jgi:ubiquinone/menaquinone biosynthesis C-methylase UbiE
MFRRLAWLFRRGSPHQRVAPDAPGFIDVRDLIDRLDDATLMRSADEYFARITPASEQCRKPWGNPVDAVHQTRHLGLVLEAADLFRGCQVLDFGCATGWLTMGLAQMGCNAIGVDIAPQALKLAEQMKSARAPAQGGGTLSFQAYDGHRLPLADASLDRIVCYDAFHHVRDQAATIREFARVLRPGGRAAFIEPGPDHSKTPQSQAEMARFAVIENDVDMAQIAQHAAEAGFEPPRMLVQFQQPFTVDVQDFLSWSRAGLPRLWAARAVLTLERQLTTSQCFFIVRQAQGGTGPDSRRAEGLRAEIVVHRVAHVPAARGRGIELEVDVRNAGPARWLTASGNGQVNLGVHLLDAQGRLVDDNFARLRIPATAGASVAPGETVRIRGTIAMPAADDFTLRLDMVAELVAWFAAKGGSQAALLHARDIAG